MLIVIVVFVVIIPLIWLQGVEEASLLIVTEKKPSLILYSLDLFQNHDTLFPDSDFTIQPRVVHKLPDV